MYASYFGLTEPPFSISPDPRYLYMSKRHREAMAHLVYGMQEGGGFVQLTGEVGTGKTTLCRCLIQQLPDNVDVALILNPQINHAELLGTLCDELHIQYPEGASPKRQLDLLNQHLLSAYSEGRKTVLVIDEAQLLTRTVLEQVRILTNLETTKQKLLQIILIGQPELSDTLTRPDLRQLAQRITARYHLEPLNLSDTKEYVKHRLAVAGGHRQLFSNAAMRSLYKFSNGVPRLINVICDRALLGAYAQTRPMVTAAMLRDAATEVLGRSVVQMRYWRWVIPAAAIVLLFMIPQIRGTILDSVHKLDASVGNNVANTEDSQLSPEPGAETEQLMEVAGLTQTEIESVQTKSNDYVSTEQSGFTQTSSQPEPPEPIISAQKIPEQESYNTEQIVQGQQFVAADFPAQDLVQNNSVPEPIVQKPFIEVLRSEDARSYGEAFSMITSVWGFNYFPDNAAVGCTAVAAEGLRCLARQGTWNNLRSYNRPALLAIRDSGQTYHVLVKGLDAQRVVLSLGGQDHVYDITAIDPYWYGEFLVLWRPPPIEGVEINTASWGADVLWLRQTLNRVAEKDGAVPVDVTTATFDAGLQQRVIDFQKHNDISADGVVGSETMIQLNTILQGANTPLLVPAS